MALYELTGHGLEARAVSGFAQLGIYERADLQRLRDDIAVLGEDLLVIAEEYGQWQDARRRIDLLALDRAGQLVVIELKRTDDGGHMDLQSIRYAAMVSSMGSDEVLDAFVEHCAKHRPTEDVDARAELIEWLGFDDTDDEVAISTSVRIVLVSADFGREITSTVLWLNGFEGMDIRCIRLVPYELDGRVLLDIQQVIPLPEAADYQVRLRRKDAARERARTSGRDFTRYHVVVDGRELPDENKRNTVRVMVEQLVRRGAPLEEIRDAMPAPAFRVLEGRFETRDAVRKALVSQHPSVTRPQRHFCEAPFVDQASNATYVLTKQWGRNTEPTLQALADRFPDSGVSFAVSSESVT